VGQGATAPATGRRRIKANKIANFHESAERTIQVSKPYICHTTIYNRTHAHRRLVLLGSNLAGASPGPWILFR